MSGNIQGGVRAGSTSVSLPFVLRKTADNTEQTGKVASDMTVSYLRQGGTRTAISPSDLAAVNTAYTSGGVKEIDATNQPGLYRLDPPDAAFAAGADWVIVTVKVSSCYVFHERFNLSTDVVQTGDLYGYMMNPTGACPALGISDAGTAQGVTSTTLQRRSAADFGSDNVVAGSVDYVWSASTGAGQARGVLSGVNSTDTDTLNAPWTVTPTGTIKYVTFAGEIAPTIPPDTNTASMSANVVTASAVAADAVTEIQSGLATAASQSTIIGYIDTEIAAILAAVDTEVAAIKAKTDLIPAAPAAVGDIPTATQNADALLKRDMSAVTGESARSMLNALRFLRNKWSISGSTLTVCKEDDTTSAWTAAVTTNSSADPITASDPA